MEEQPKWKLVVKIIFLILLIILIILGVKILISNLGNIVAEYGPSP